MRGGGRRTGRKKGDGGGERGPLTEREVFKEGERGSRKRDRGRRKRKRRTTKQKTK